MFIHPFSFPNLSSSLLKISQVPPAQVPKLTRQRILPKFYFQILRTASLPCLQSAVHGWQHAWSPCALRIPYSAGQFLRRSLKDLWEREDALILFHHWSRSTMIPNVEISWFALLVLFPVTMVLCLLNSWDELWVLCCTVWSWKGNTYPNCAILWYSWKALFTRNC